MRAALYAPPNFLGGLVGFGFVGFLLDDRETKVEHRPKCIDKFIPFCLCPADAFGWQAGKKAIKGGG